MKLAQEFKAFIARGNVIDLAVAVVIGTAFGGIVNAIVAGLIMPLIAKVLPGGEWQTWSPGGFALGAVLAAIINFVVIAAVVFLIVVKMLRFLRKPDEAPAATKTCPQCLEKIPAAAQRCRACTSPVAIV